MTSLVRAELLDLVLPRRCLSCGRPGTPLCAACLTPSAALVDGGRFRLPVAAGGRYEMVLRTAVLAYKERGRRDLAGVLGRLLAAALDVLRPADGAAVVVPIPSTRRVAAARGGDHVARLTRVACAAAGRRWTPALAVAGRARDSAGLSAVARAANLAGVLRAHGPPLPARRCVLVDDVVTTGATLAEAQRALEVAGWSVVGAATVAWTPRRRPDRVGTDIPSQVTLRV